MNKLIILLVVSVLLTTVSAGVLDKFREGLNNIKTANPASKNAIKVASAIPAHLKTISKDVQKLNKLLLKSKVAALKKKDAKADQKAAGEILREAEATIKRSLAVFNEDLTAVNKASKSISETTKPEPTKPEPTPETKPTKPTTPTNTKCTNYETTTNVNIRSGAGTSFDKIRTTASGEVVCVVSISKGWAKLDNGNYISEKYIVKSGKKETKPTDNTKPESNGDDGTMVYPNGTNKPPTITSPFAMRADPFGGNKQEDHKGIDCVGFDDIKAMAKGKVTAAHYSKSAGNMVFIDHGNGLVSKYMHMLDGSLAVKANQQVAKGQKLGVMGSTGRSTGKHLHFQVEVNGKPVEPFEYVAARLG